MNEAQHKIQDEFDSHFKEFAGKVRILYVDEDAGILLGLAKDKYLQHFLNSNTKIYLDHLKKKWPHLSHLHFWEDTKGAI